MIFLKTQKKTNQAWTLSDSSGLSIDRSIHTCVLVHLSFSFSLLLSFLINTKYRNIKKKGEWKKISFFFSCSFLNVCTSVCFLFVLVTFLSFVFVIKTKQRPSISIEQGKKWSLVWFSIDFFAFSFWYQFIFYLFWSWWIFLHKFSKICLSFLY